MTHIMRRISASSLAQESAPVSIAVAGAASSGAIAVCAEMPQALAIGLDARPYPFEVVLLTTPSSRPVTLSTRAGMGELVRFHLVITGAFASAPSGRMSAMSPIGTRSSLRTAARLGRVTTAAGSSVNSGKRPGAVCASTGLVDLRVRARPERPLD